jgi:transposase
LRWRQQEELPPAMLTVRSPYDEDVRFSRKRATDWVGYKVHLTETCDPEAPRIITHVETSPAPMADERLTAPIHAALQAQDLLPDNHLVDTAYLDAELLVDSQRDYHVNLVGPTRRDTGWQARQAGNPFAAKDFQIDWEHQHAICPAGQQSQFWMPAIDSHGHEVIQIKFSKRVCRTCPVQSQCTRSNPPRRAITVQPEARY